MRATALLVLIMSFLGPGSFFGTGKKKSLDPWQWSRAEGQQRTIPGSRPERETQDVPSTRQPAESEKAGEPGEAEDANDEQWQKIERSGNQMARKWVRAEAERIEQLAEEVRQQSQAELQWLRTIAEKEQATETVRAIDKLLAAQQERYTKIEEEFEEQRLKGKEGGRGGTRQRLSREERRRAWEERRRSRRSSRRSRSRESDEDFDRD